MDIAIHEVDFLAQSHWHHFRYRIGDEDSDDVTDGDLVVVENR